MTKCQHCDAEVLSTSQPAAWECMGRKQSLPEPGECNWPDCGCDPHATKVIESLLEQGWTGPAALAATPAVGGEDLRKRIAEINVDQDKHSEGNLQYVLIRGFSAMGWSQPTLASNDALDAIATLAQPASPLRGTLWGQIAAIYEGADDVDAAWIDREWMKMRKLPASLPEQPAALTERLEIADRIKSEGGITIVHASPDQAEADRIRKVIVDALEQPVSNKEIQA